MMYADPHHQHPPQHFQQPPPDFHRGPPPPQMMRHPSASSTNLAPEFHHPGPGGPPLLITTFMVISMVQKRIRKLAQRKAVDYTSTVVRYMQIRMCQQDSRDRTVLQPPPAAAIDIAKITILRPQLAAP